jgi:DNA-binding protein H-NS
VSTNQPFQRNWTRHNKRHEGDVAKPNLNDFDVDDLLELRADVEKALAERGRDLQRQLALLGGAVAKQRGRPAGRPGRVSAMRGKSVLPKYRGPGGETWAGRGATPRWLTALVKEGHSIEEFAIGKGGKRAAASAKKSAARKGRKPAPKQRDRKARSSKEATETAA